MEDFQTEVSKVFTKHLKKHLQEKQSTVVASIGILTRNAFTKLITVCTGVKCLPDKTIEKDANALIHDSHAEVLCRRALVFYLLNEIKKDHSDIIEITSNSKRISKDVEFVMYISHMPCGDASMHLYLDEREKNLIDSIPVKRRKVKGVDEGKEEGKEREEEEGKEGKEREEEGKEEGEEEGKGLVQRGRENVMVGGVLRTKPGRRDSPPTSCLSCADKIALWNTIGWQGALLDLNEPIYIKRMVIDQGYNEEALNFSINRRFQNNNNEIKLSFDASPRGIMFIS
jgi:tRNA-specific adenosine deaminase 1